MQISNIKKSQKTHERIEFILNELNNYRNSSERIKYSLKTQISYKKAPHAPRVIKYSCISKSEECFRWTLQNINTQVLLLERELAALIEFGE